MTMIIRVKNADGTNPTVLERASNQTLRETLNSGDESISFELSKNDPKADLLNPETNNGYAMLWEAWDSETNTRLNEGPITEIADSSSGNWKFTGKGRSAYLGDIISSKKTFYAPIDKLIDELRYENIAIEPRTTTLVHSDDDSSSDEDTFFGPVGEDPALIALSKFSKDNIIDETTGFIALGKTEPSREFYRTDSFWAGAGPVDAIVADLGAEYPLSKIKLLFPWWGGPARATDRTYQFELAYASEGTTLTGVQGRSSSAFTTLYTTPDPNRLVTKPNYEMEFYLGATLSGGGFGFNRYNVANNLAGPVNIRYIRIGISQVRAWYGNAFDDDASYDAWDYQCDPDYTPGTNPNISATKKGLMAGKTFNDRALAPANDCLASVVELGAFREIVPKKTINPLALQKIDNNNLQLTYYHAADASETRTSKSGGVTYRFYEPGTFFRKATITYTGATSNHTKFYTTDCTNCYSDGFHFGVMDHDNNLIYATDNTSGTNVEITSGIFTRYLRTFGATNAQITSIDAWKGQSDPLSFGGSYSYTETANDWVTAHFRGQSFQWYATVPSDKTGATVKIEYRHKANGWARWAGRLRNDYWSGWTTLENSYKIPDNISGEKVYEITYDSGTLVPNTVYEIRITNLDGNYCSVDSIEGYWSASFTMYNEDSTRINVSTQAAFTQLYNKRFSAGSMYKWNTSGAGVSLTFEGDRIIILSAKGRNHGKLRLLMYRYTTEYGLYDPGTVDHIFIPNGDPSDGSLTINLATGKKGNETTQYVIFDSNTAFPDGMAWGSYGISLSYRDVEQYSAKKADTSSDSFTHRCADCTTTAGTILTNKYVYLDAIGIHEKLGISVTFDNKTNIEQLSSIAELIQSEWKVGEEGLQFEPRIGTDTDYILREGDNTLINYDITYDASNVASMLLSYGTDIDGYPLFTLTEDKNNRTVLGRTVMRQNDFRDIGDYPTLIGLSRGELRRRRTPAKRITVTHIGNRFPVEIGDSFILYTKKLGPIRVRITGKERSESGSGTTFNLECVKWPPII
jgi:hypothetical protein